MDAKIRQNTMVVERSGCETIRNARIPNKTTDSTIYFTVFSLSLFFLRNSAKNRIMNILAISDGWNRKPPISSHLCAPPPSSPMKMTRASNTTFAA
jgi:hypothetical protein